MDSIRQTADEIFRDRIRRARAMTPEEKLCGGIALFEEVCQRMRDGVRMQFPEATAEQVEQIVHQRLKRLRRLEEHGIYQPITGVKE